MRLISPLAFMLFLLTLLPLAADAAKRAPAGAAGKSAAAEQEVLHDFEQILDLWRDGSYDDLYQRTGDGKDSKELFTRKLASAPRRPACCWEKMQETQVSLKNPDRAVVRARLGFEGSLPGTQFVTKGIQMKKEGGVWTISQSELFSLANFSKKRAVYKYLPIQGK